MSESTPNRRGMMVVVAILLVILIVVAVVVVMALTGDDEGGGETGSTACTFTAFDATFAVYASPVQGGEVLRELTGGETGYVVVAMAEDFYALDLSPDERVWVFEDAGRVTGDCTDVPRQ